MKTRVSLKYFVTDCRLYLLALVSGERLVCYFDCVTCTYILTKNTCEILTNETPEQYVNLFKVNKKVPDWY